MRMKILRRILLIAGAATMVGAMVAVAPAAATTTTSAPTGQGYTWTGVNVPGAWGTLPDSVNDQGVVTGLYWATVNDFESVSHGFVEWGGHYATVDYPNAASSVVAGVTAFGEIVGYYTTSDGVNYGFTDVGGRFTTIQDPYADNAPGFGTQIVEVNSFGEMVGVYYDSAGTYHGFVYQNGRFTTLDCPGAGTGPGEGTYLGSVDNGGAIAVECYETSGYYNSIYQYGRFNTVPNVPGSASSYISWVIDTGESGGAYYTSAGILDAYTYQYGRFTLIHNPFGGPYMIELNGANDFGAIAGITYEGSVGLYYGFVMTPKH